MAGFSLTGDRDLLAWQGKLMKSIVGVPQAVREVNRRYKSVMLQTLIKNSSGRPGPEVDTGAYNAAYVVEVAEDEMSVGADNPSPQSDRLEYGFVDTDSLGRHYQQPPYPHFRPTLDELGPRYAEDIAKAFPSWWEKNK